MLKIYHIISGDLWAGAEVMAYNLLKSLKAMDGLQVSAILLNEERLASELRDLDIQVHVVDEASYSFLSILKRIKRIVNRNKPNIIHSHRYKENLLALLVSTGLLNTKIVCTQHGMQEANKKHFELKSKLFWKINTFLQSRYFHQVVVVSQDMKNNFHDQYGFRDEKVHVISNGIDVRSTAGVMNKQVDFVIGSAGRLSQVKDYTLMIEIAKKTRKKTNNIHFRLAGEGPDRSKIESLITAYQLDDIFTIEGHVDDMSSFYNHIDLYLNTSLHEGIPMSILEAMAHTCPVVAPRVGGLPEIVDSGVEGFLIRNRDPAKFANKCIQLYQDPALRKKMAEAARQKVMNQFSMEAMAQHYESLYHNLAEKTH